MTLSAGTQLGRYEIRSKLGEGGMGEVYLALDTKLGRKVALKILPTDVAANRGRMSRFGQEAKAASALNHPNILTIYEIDQADSVHFIATEFIDGETLRHRMKSAPLKLGDVLDVAAQIASALSAAHAAGIVHRDIKPENIMLRRDGIAKVLDFGLAKLTERLPPDSIDTEAPTSFKTDPGIVVGTTAYMSPEQARGLVVDARTDIFSFGIVLYEMVAARLPFEGSTSSEVVASILSDNKPQPLARYASEVPAELERIVSKALRKSRDQRYQTIQDMLLDLKSVMQEVEFEKKLERATPPKLASRAGTREPEGIGTSVESATRSTLGERRAASATKLNQRSTVIALAALLIMVSVAIVAAYFAYARYWAEGSRSNIDSTAGIRSIAVLPFANTSKDPETEYLSDGLSESLINRLSQLPSVKVSARVSSFKYKGKEVDFQEVARTLGVEGILTGRVEQRGENILISAELVDARDRTQVWGEQYNRKMTDLLAVQSDISREIAETLRLKLTVTEQEQLVKRETANPQAYEQLLKARFYDAKGGTENQKKAIEYYQQAIAIDPKYAIAYAELSGSYWGLATDSILDPKEAIPKAEEAARKALQLDETLAEARLAMAGIKRTAWDWSAAGREYQRAIQLNPNLAVAHHSYATYLSLMARHEQAIAEIKRARELDPLSPSVNLGVGVRLNFARQHDQAIEALKKTLEMDPNFAPAHIHLAYSYASKGMYPEAIAAYQKFIELSGDDTSVQTSLGQAYANWGQRKKARAILKRVETSKEYVSPSELATLYAALGERERAFASLERAFAARDPQLQYLGVDPSFDPLRSDRRFGELLRRVGLSP